MVFSPDGQLVASASVEKIQKLTNDESGSFLITRNICSLLFGRPETVKLAAIVGCVLEPEKLISKLLCSWILRVKVSPTSSTPIVGIAYLKP